ncbi:MAG: hypothetical protein WCF59_02115 [Desulfobaccales bacterium]
MRNVKLPSGFVKVERSEEEKRRSFAVNDAFIESFKKKITSDNITNIIVNACKRSKGKR